MKIVTVRHPHAAYRLQIGLDKGHHFYDNVNCDVEGLASCLARFSSFSEFSAVGWISLSDCGPTEYGDLHRFASEQLEQLELGFNHQFRQYEPRSFRVPFHFDYHYQRECWAVPRAHPI
jgi:hypothetical protein